MSPISPTTPPPATTGAAHPWGFRRWFALSMTVAVLIVVVGMAPVGHFVVEAARQAHPHGLDTGLFARLPMVIKLHLLAAVAALALGAVLMAVRKGRTFHRTAGWVWVSLVATVVGSSIFIRELNHSRFSWIHLFTAWTLLALPLAVLFARRHDVARHRRTMMGLFYGGFAINLLFAFIPGRTMWRLFFG